MAYGLERSNLWTAVRLQAYQQAGDGAAQDALRAYSKGGANRPAWHDRWVSPSFGAFTRRAHTRLAAARAADNGAVLFLRTPDGACCIRAGVARLDANMVPGYVWLPDADLGRDVLHRTYPSALVLLPDRDGRRCGWCKGPRHYGAC